MNDEKQTPMFFSRRKKSETNAEQTGLPHKAGKGVPVQSRHLIDRPLSPCADDLTVFRSTHWISTKVWLPEPLDERLTGLAEHQITSRSTMIRDALFQFVYGSYRFEQMRSQQEGLFWEPKLKDIPMFSRSPTAQYDLGKNIVNVRVWLPARLKEDLGLLASKAGKAGKTWSHFVREALIFHFMGHQLLAEADAVLKAARQHPDDDEVAGNDGE